MLAIIVVQHAQCLTFSSVATDLAKSRYVRLLQWDNKLTSTTIPHCTYMSSIFANKHLCVSSCEEFIHKGLHTSLKIFSNERLIKVQGLNLYGLSQLPWM